MPCLVPVPGQLPRQLSALALAVVLCRCSCRTGLYRSTLPEIVVRVVTEVASGSPSFSSPFLLIFPLSGASPTLVAISSTNFTPRSGAPGVSHGQGDTYEAALVQGQLFYDVSSSLCTSAFRQQGHRSSHHRPNPNRRIWNCKVNIIEEMFVVSGRSGVPQAPPPTEGY